LAAPIEPRIDTLTFKSSKKDLNAPLIFLVGGVAVPAQPKEKDPAKRVDPGTYMWGDSPHGYDKGFSRATDFNIYNTQNVSLKKQSQKELDTSAIKSAVTDCKKILQSKGINPSKKILIGYSKGCEAYQIVVDEWGGGYETWDYILIAGVYSQKGDPAVDTILQSVDRIASHLQKYPDKVYYFSSNSDGTGKKATSKLKDAAKSGHYIEKPFGVSSHSGLPNALTTWVMNNVSVNNTAQSSNTTSNNGTQGNGTNGTDGTQGNGTNGTFGTDNGGGGGQDGDTPESGTSGTGGEQPVTSGNDCGDLTKLDAKPKANEAPEGADNVDKDPIPPSKTDTPVSADGKYNHRYYLIPLKDNQPMSLADMAKKENKYHKRYWAWRPDEGRGFGDSKYEYTVNTDTGISLMAGLVPYWPPPKDFEDNATEPTVKGNWSSLIAGQKPIESFLDIPILLNSYDVGVYNNNIEYIFEAGNELHMTLVNSSLMKNKGSQLGIGKADNTDIVEKNKKDSSWRNWPKWSGIFVDHCLKQCGYSLLSTITANINTYHEEILSKDKLINYPGNKQWKWKKEMKPAGMQDNVFKPSKIWLDPTNLNSDELLKDKGDIAILIPDFHFTKEGNITPKGEKLLTHLLKMNWKLGIISAVKSHTVQSSQLYAEVLVFLDVQGKLITIGGNTTPKGADSTASGGHHIAIKETTLKEFAQMSNDSWVNGAIFISKPKSSPEGHREGGLDSKIYVSSIFKDYYERIDKEPGKLTGRMFNTLLPYISKKPAAPAPERNLETSLQTTFTPPPDVATGGSGASGARGGIVTQDPETAVKAGIMVKLPAKYATNVPYLRTEAAKTWLAMLQYMETQGFSSSAKVGTGKLIFATSIFRSNLKQAQLWNGLVSPKPASGVPLYNSAAGNRKAVAPPAGTYWSGGAIGAGSGKSAGGSWHMWGRATDMKGVNGKVYKGGDFAAYWNTATLAQKWIITYGGKWGWYGYDNEVWHIYDQNSSSDDAVKKLKLL
jgi:hypothetical protein